MSKNIRALGGGPELTLPIMRLIPTSRGRLPISTPDGELKIPIEVKPSKDGELNIPMTTKPSKDGKVDSLLKKPLEK